MASLPRDDNNQPIPLTPSSPTLARTINNSISSSTEIALNANTTFIEVYAISQDIYLRWGAADVSSSNFDEVIPAGTIRDFIPARGTTHVNFIERVAGATLICIEK